MVFLCSAQKHDTQIGYLLKERNRIHRIVTVEEKR